MRKAINKKNVKRVLHLGLLVTGLMVVISGISGAGI
jgi:hypothetical protein